MIDDLRPYPEYRESGLTWLACIPKHWMVRRVKYVLREMDTRSNNGKEPLLRVSQYTGVTKRNQIDGLASADTRAASLIGYKRVEPNDLVVNIMLAWNGSMGVSPFVGITSPAYCVYRFGPTMHPWYFHYLLRSPVYKQRIKSVSTGVVESRLRLYSDDLGRIEALLPPPDEQASIVRFLDWANGRLERAIRAKRKAIALLNEQKQAIIQQAVTRGLDPHVPLKPSGIPWLGDVPEHWEVRRLKYCISPVEQGWSPQCDSQPAGENEWGVLKVGCVNKDVFAPEQNKKLPDSIRPDPRLAICNGDILVSRANTRELLGLAAVAENPPAQRILCDKLFRFRAKGDYFNAKFLVFILRAKPSRTQIESSTNGASSSMQNIGQGVLKNLWVSMPTVSEQDRIVTYITTATQPIDTAIARLEREIGLLREFRTRLVSDVVTGKLDVRAVAARLADENVPAVDLDDAELDNELAFEDEEVAV